MPHYANLSSTRRATTIVSRQRFTTIIENEAEFILQIIEIAIYLLA